MSREQLRQSERLASIGTLAAGIAHEINNPTGAILLAAKNALSVAGEANALHTMRRFLHQIVEEAQRCGQIVKGVLQFARKEQTDKWPNDLTALVRRAVELTRQHADDHGVTIRQEQADDLPLVVMNPIEMEQVVINLLRNAIEAGDGTGHVTIRTERTDRAVRIIVHDDGSGITEDQKRHLFDPFYTTRQQQGGTGLGLSITHGIVTDHGGTIAVDSNPGCGTTVTVELPCDDGSSREVARV
jgi:two-component system NtrC family sensor kinase